MNTLFELFEEQIKDVYSAESQLLKALPKMIKKASTDALKKGLELHLAETEEQVARLEKIASQLDFKPTGKKCKAMEGLIEEGKEVLEEEGMPSVIDVAIIAASQRIEHYEISSYGTLIAIAEQLELSEAVELLQQTLDEEITADENLTEVCESQVFPMALEDSDVEDEDESDMDDSEESAQT